MSIDWVTVAAQLANFLLLVWLLRRFLYRPILDGIDAREAEIARRLAAAEQARSDARAAEAQHLREYQRNLADRDTMIAQALSSTEQERDRLLADAQARLAQEQQEWHRHLEAERADFVQRLQRAGALTLIELVRKVLHDLADDTLEAAIVRRAGRQLAPMAAELAAAAGGSRQAVIGTHAELDDDAKAQVRAALQRLLPGVQPHFAVDAAQARGLTLQLGGARVAWTIDSYLDEFDSAVLRDQAACLPPRPHAAPPPPAGGR
ncbi:MAG TPA: hypothetical protein PLB26_10635 [Rubrivivax sp.]|nr:hypothetical protein [Rubrivivax sp.]